MDENKKILAPELISKSDINSFTDPEEKQIKLDKKRESLLEKVSNLIDSDVLSRVGLILNHYPTTRDSDIELQIKYWELYEKDLINGNKIYLDEYRKLTKLTSISRSRAFIQNTLGLFQARPEIQELRGVAKDEIETSIKENKPDYPIAYIFADESGKNDTNIIVGGVWFLDGIVMNQFAGDLLAWKQNERFKGEIKFKNINENNLKSYMKLVDIVIAKASLISFKAKVLKRAGLSNIQDAICKMYAQMITTGVTNEIETGRMNLPRYLQIVKDAEEEGYDNLLLSEIQERLRNLSASQYNNKLDVLKCMKEDSRENAFLQIADLFTGCIARYANSQNTFSPKDILSKYFLDLTGAMFNLGSFADQSDIVNIF
jgi:hypothetical protein